MSNPSFENLRVFYIFTTIITFFFSSFSSSRSPLPSGKIKLPQFGKFPIFGGSEFTLNEFFCGHSSILVEAQAFHQSVR